MISILVALSIALLLGLLPIGVRLSYDEQGFLVWLKLGVIKIKLYPQIKKAPHVKSSGKSNKTKEDKNETKGGSLVDFLPIAKNVFEFLSELRKKLWVQKLYFRLNLAEGDPCDLAVHYGEAWAALGSVMALLEQYVKIKDRDLQIHCDFTGGKTDVAASADILISLGRLVAIALRHGVRGLKKYQLLSKKIKAV